DLGRVAALADPARRGALDGLLGAAAADIVVPGLTAERPISASALQVLLQCPHLFLLGHLLRFEEPAAPPALREIEQPSYGSLVHAVAERFFRAHGDRLCAGDGRLADWQAAAEAVADRCFDEFVEQYPLPGEAVRNRERQRLRDDVRELLEYEWRLGRRRFVAAERGFGEPVPVELALGGRSLFVRGTIDRIDADDRRTFVRDFKTGRVLPRIGDAAGPDAVMDVQIAVYGLVAQRLASRWGVPPRVGVAYVGRHGDERTFEDDFERTLAPAAQQWLALAADLLAARAFPRTPDPSDCSYCRFRPVCGERVYERAAEVLAGGDDALRRLLALKGDAGDD
ncbi:MAG: RecB family exonuclease, partial [Candidatus Rokuibacteriota bacterium]